MRIGFSTGTMALEQLGEGLKTASLSGLQAVELSALREEELDPLLRSLKDLDSELSRFDYISFHAPSKRRQLSELEFVEKLRPVAARGWAIIVHPDVIEDPAIWRRLGSAVCIENMDKRKPVGRTASQLQSIFEDLPEATFCFDIGHARQVDPTMLEASRFLRMFRERLRQVHMSVVNSQSKHERLNFESICAFSLVAQWIEKSVPIILESPIVFSQLDQEIQSVEEVFRRSKNRSSSTRSIAQPTG